MTNLDEDPKVADLRSKLHAYFVQRGQEAGIEIHPTEWEERIRVLVGRLYEEAKGERQFFVSPSELPGVEAFVKETGLLYDKLLLQVHTEKTDMFFPKIWTAYVSWMHESCSPEAVLSALDNSAT